MIESVLAGGSIGATETPGVSIAASQVLQLSTLIVERYLELLNDSTALSSTTEDSHELSQYAPELVAVTKFLGALSETPQVLDWVLDLIPEAREDISSQRVLLDTTLSTPRPSQKSRSGSLILLDGL